MLLAPWHRASPQLPLEGASAVSCQGWPPACHTPGRLCFPVSVGVPNRNLLLHFCDGHCTSFSFSRAPRPRNCAPLASSVLHSSPPAAAIVAKATFVVTPC